MAKLSTFRDVVTSRSAKIEPKAPIGATEQFIKYDQPWPINKEKDDKDKPSNAKKQKTEEKEDDPAKALKRINTDAVFDKEKYLSIPSIGRKELNDDTRIYSFKHPLKSVKSFNLGIGQHILCAFVLQDGSIVERPYAIVRPIGADEDDGTIDILVKTAFPTEKDPGGTVSNILDCLDTSRQDEMLVRGPEGPITYLGNGKFSISVDGKKPKEVHCNRINFISGGTGMTPIYATIRAILETDAKDSNLQVKFMDANIRKQEILLRDSLDELTDKHDRLEVIHVLEQLEDGMKAEEGMIDKDKMQRRLFAAEEGTISLVCGPPPMMKAAKEGLVELGFKDGETFFHY